MNSVSTLDKERDSYRQEQSAILMEFGRSIRRWCDQSSQRILLVISGDQAHTHAWSAQLPPIYQPDPSAFSRFPQSGIVQANRFDEIIENWMTGNNCITDNKLYRMDEKLLIDEAGALEKVALSCGYTGSLTMQGVLESDLIQNRTVDPAELVSQSAEWLLSYFISCHPTYYGMTAALYIRNVK